MRHFRSLETALSQASVLVCAGTGGVGKTTIASALGVASARRGRNALILTIDPARRLADALGLADSGATAIPVDLDGLERDPAAPAFGRLEAMMLDPKPTFDRLIERLTPNAEARERILGNHIYRHLSEALAGSAEYAAMEQVHELVESGYYDLIIVDTPPANHALDFLRAPRRLREFLASRLVRTLLQPAMSASRFGVRFFGRSMHRVLSVVERVAGVGFLDDLTEFLAAIDTLSLGFQERATRVEEMLIGDRSAFVLVCGPYARANESALEFLDELEEFRVPLVAAIANRLRPWPVAMAPAEFGALLTRPESQQSLDRDLETIRGRTPNALEGDLHSIVRALTREANHCEAEARAVSRVEHAVRGHGLEFLRVAERGEAIGALAGIDAIATELFGPRELETREEPLENAR